MQKVKKNIKQYENIPPRESLIYPFRLINSEHRQKSYEMEILYYSNKANLFGEHTDDTIYATLEENFTKVDGTMFFPPRSSSADVFYDTGLIGKELVSDVAYELTINLHMDATDFKGLTINFGENYPIDFDVVGSTGQVIEFRNNTESKWSTEEVIENTTYIKMVSIE